MSETIVTNPKKGTKVFTYDVAFVLQVLAENEKEANAICARDGGYIVSREQTLKSVTDLTNQQQE